MGRARAVNDRPDRFELFLLGDGEKKVTVETITQVPNAALFTFQKEDHTLANLLRDQLNRSPHCTFAAYKVPHPLFPTFQLRVHTDGTLTPKEAVINACREAVQALEKLSQNFTKEWELKKIANVGSADIGY
ncbi:DNA-directed RNA polymerase II core subunit [Elasticomyces elasticus]|nr:DNA-directed RNA polymerase II core subunit [Elasticomyces elasticus]